MSTWKHIGCLSAALLPAMLSKGGEHRAVPCRDISGACDHAA